jgi:sugar/nucleoside kinase (ribokinase family)
MVPDVIVVGDVMIDVSVAGPALVGGGDVRGEVRLRPAGAGANVAVWAAWAGATVRLHGAVGDDVAGRMVGEALAARGVDARLTVKTGVRTGAMLVVHQAGERSMVADRGANAALAPDDLPETLEAGAVMVPGYVLFDPGSEAAASAALAGARASHVAVDASSWPLLRDFGPDRFVERTTAATLLLANEREAGMLPGYEADGVDALTRHYRMVAVKGGADGAMLATARSVIRGESPHVEDLDPTGAGDAFDGALLASLAAGLGAFEALERACGAGALAAGSADVWPAQ